MNWLDNIKAIKKSRGYTNEQLSARSGISLGTLNKLLAGTSEDPKLSTLTSLAETFGIGLDELLGVGDDCGLSKELSERYAALDNRGRDAVAYIINKEYARTVRENSSSPYSLDTPEIRRIPLFETAASAGMGIMLDGDDHTEISVYSNSVTDSADFAVKVSGDSMMPKYHNGDILLVRRADIIAIGELGIFSLNSEGYFKKYGGDRLISLNAEYRDIPLRADDDVHCFGKVIGRLRK